MLHKPPIYEIVFLEESSVIATFVAGKVEEVICVRIKKKKF